MGREAQKKREEEAAAQEAEAPIEEALPGEEPDADQTQVQIDPSMLGMLAAPGMTAMEDRRYLVQTIAVGKKDASGLRELSFPITPMKTITLVLAEDLQQHILKQLAGGVEIADLTDIAAEAEKARQAEAASEIETP